MSTLPRLNLSVRFILMRDQREPTHVNVAAQAESEVLADHLPKVLASRLRAARKAVGASQAAVAKAMADRGFSWRQTTVAKSEAADRPVLFAEVAALSQIYKKKIEYFLYPGTELDGLLDEAYSDMSSIRAALAEAERGAAALKSDLDLYECITALASDIRRYQSSSDSGPLLNGVWSALRRWGYRCLTMYEVYESVEIDREQLEAVDSVALVEAARIVQGLSARLASYEGKDVESGFFAGVDAFLEGKEVSAEVIETLRGGPEWTAFAAPLLADLIVTAVNSQLD